MELDKKDRPCFDEDGNKCPFCTVACGNDWCAYSGKDEDKDKKKEEEGKDGK